MPVALMYPSLDRLCCVSPISTDFFHPVQFSESYHQKVRLWVFPVRSLDEDAARAEVAGKRHAQVRVVEDTKVVRFGRVRGANLARLDFQFGLPEAAALNKDLVYNARMVSLEVPCERAGALGNRRTTRRAFFGQHRIPVLGKNALDCHCG
jgi:hypothetical protein